MRMPNLLLCIPTVYVACSQMESSVAQQMAACNVAFGAPNTFSYLTTACAPMGCVLKIVQTLKDVKACQLAGFPTNNSQSTMAPDEASESIATLQYLCTQRTAASYCVADTATWRTLNGMPTCAEFVNSGCCLSNFLAILGAIDPAQVLQVSEVIKTQCNVDASSITPCQPPGWANVTFAGRV